MCSIIPVLFQAIPYQQHSTVDYYVDGGLLCNFPIHCFDGKIVKFITFMHYIFVINNMKCTSKRIPIMGAVAKKIEMYTSCCKFSV